MVKGLLNISGPWSDPGLIQSRGHNCPESTRDGGDQTADSRIFDKPGRPGYFHGYRIALFPPRLTGNSQETQTLTNRWNSENTRGWDLEKKERPVSQDITGMRSGKRSDSN